MISAISNKATIRKGAPVASVERLIGTYQIRLRMARKLGTSEQVADLTFLVENMKNRAHQLAAIWFIHAADGRKFHLFECIDNDFPLGCIKGQVEADLPH